MAKNCSHSTVISHFFKVEYAQTSQSTFFRFVWCSNGKNQNNTVFCQTQDIAKKLLYILSFPSNCIRNVYPHYFSLRFLPNADTFHVKKSNNTNCLDILQGLLPNHQLLESKKFSIKASLKAKAIKKIFIPCFQSYLLSLPRIKKWSIFFCS